MQTHPVVIPFQVAHALIVAREMCPFLLDYLKTDGRLHKKLDSIQRAIWLNSVFAVAEIYR